jgi:hypothetical protein
MDFSQLLNPTTMAVLAPFVLFFRHIQTFVKRVFTFFIRTDVISGEHSRYFVNYILDNSVKINFGNQNYTSERDYSKHHKRYLGFSYAYRNQYILLFKNRIPLFISSNYDNFNITYLFTTINVKEHFKNAIQEQYYNDEKKRIKNQRNFFFSKANGHYEAHPSSESKQPMGRSSAQLSDSPESPNSMFADYYKIPKHLDYVDLGYDDLGEEICREYAPNYYWTKEAKLFKREVEYWHKHRDWFTERQVPWRRGCLLSGKPGTGKSKMVYNTCIALDIPLYQIDISRMSNEEFESTVENAQHGSVFLIEDIDAVFDGRKNTLDQGNMAKQLMTFDCLINTISGAKDKSGYFWVVTTNNIEKLDFALLRAGRLDKKIEVLMIDDDGKQYIASNILKDWPNEIEKIIGETGEISVAEFENKCIERAQEIFWKTKG